MVSNTLKHIHIFTEKEYIYCDMCEYKVDMPSSQNVYLRILASKLHSSPARNSLLFHLHLKNIEFCQKTISAVISS